MPDTRRLLSTILGSLLVLCPVALLSDETTRDDSSTESSEGKPSGDGTSDETQSSGGAGGSARDDSSGADGESAGAGDSGGDEAASGGEEAAPGAVEPAAVASLSGPGVILLSGQVVPGEIVAVGDDGSVRIEGRDEPIPAYELQEIRLEAKPENPEAKPEFDRGPVVQFQGRELLIARVADVTDEKARLRLSGLSVEPVVPIEAIRAFRLREAYERDPLYEERLAQPEPPARDTVFARRQNLLAVEGIFRGLDAEFLRFERGGRALRLARQRVQGLILGPLASTTPESDPPALLDLIDPASRRRLGQIPAYLRGVVRERGELTHLRVRFPGGAANDFQSIPIEAVERLSFASDRVVFLSSLEPSRVEETAVVGSPISYRKDECVGRGPLRLGGRIYKKGLGVHSRSALEYQLLGQYQSFAAVIGIDDSTGDLGSVTFRVLADGKEIYQKDLGGKDDPVQVSLPVAEVQTLRLEADYGADGLDTGDHANWASARVSK